ncbi:SusC/RagA family TonB-linked outer membrane protein [Pinibacter aurantiacus]|uniref:SusC/RagA family TonB-linked outer membrane protein n=1 Tax=Pinibacter aurantiacus TaxID=2851599 RepID=A0A9E2SDU0_9BACT|nr:SusC/RagA family TonB-linked outer membrane protein [Pinibacter aurantiacus]MBV4358760.1 SusC/RagA family TonB-linked outer membrane protein [Pinibacter aurantiacus]
MKKYTNCSNQRGVLRPKLCLIKTVLTVCFLFCFITFSIAQTTQKITGKVFNEKNEPMEGASVTLAGTKISTGTGRDGTFSLTVNSADAKLEITAVNYVGKNVTLKPGETNVIVRLELNPKNMEDVVVIGYGKQKKQSVVGAIAQTTGEALQRAGGVNNLGMALTGNLPGVITMSSTGMPGAEDPQILIRAQTSWNNSSPLILVDGIERSMSSIDIASVQSVSVLKDASATAVFGVKGANGVILITTKQGAKGKANIQVRYNATAKTASKLPEKYDSYDALVLKNQTIARELMLGSNGWKAYKPMAIIDKYRNPANDKERDQYPNVNWTDELFKKVAMAHNASANVSGGSDFVTYYAGVDFVYEGDLFKTFQNGRGYESGYGYTRANVRSNLDFNLTKTTKLSTKLFGSNGVRKLPWGAADGDASYWASAYRTAPDAMQPVYSDGTWGFYSPRNADVPNSAFNLAMSGVEKRTNTQLTTDFILQQDLGMLLKGLSFRGNFSMDNTFQETGRGINDLYNSAQRKWVDPETGTVYYEQQINTGTQLDYTDGVRWTSQAGSVNTGATYRRTNYSMQLNWAQKFGARKLHDVSAMGVFLREKYATGSEFPHYREDWVFRTTYNYASRYFLEANGAYNGSEKFGPDNRFAFFPSLSAGWMLSNERFMQKLPFINTFKIRASWGKIGDDNVSGRWLYQDQWTYGGNYAMGDIPANTPYTFYDISSLGNPNIAWETVEKRNLGVDYSLFGGRVTGSVDVFRDDRSNIIINGSSRAIPTYFGATAPSANLGRVVANGYEVELGLNQTFTNGMRVWVNASMTHAKNKVISQNNPQLLPAYQKSEGYAIGQTTSYLDYGFLKSWDDLYGSTQRGTNNQSKLTGDYNIVDFNGDGVIDSYDKAPYKFSSVPQNTFNTSVGVEWKGVNLFVQFYGVNNVTREVTFPTFVASSDVAYVEGTYWTLNGGGNIPLPRWSSVVGNEAPGTRYLYDGSFLRLKNAEIGYTLKNQIVNRLGIKRCKVYLNGNNLFLWTKMPDDRESNFSGNSSFGAYPTLKRFNLGIDLTF